MIWLSAYVAAMLPSFIVFFRHERQNNESDSWTELKSDFSWSCAWALIWPFGWILFSLVRYCVASERREKDGRDPIGHRALRTLDTIVGGTR